MVVTGLSQVDTEHVMDLTEQVMWHTLGERTKQHNNNSNAPRLQTLFSTETTKISFGWCHSSIRPSPGREKTENNSLDMIEP